MRFFLKNRTNHFLCHIYFESMIFQIYKLSTESLANDNELSNGYGG